MQICGHNASRMVSPITLAVVSEDGRGTSARIEIVEAARGVMQLAGRSGDVRSWRQSGRHMLVWSFSAFDPEQTSRGPNYLVPAVADLPRRVAGLFFEVGGMLATTKSRKARTFAGGRWREG